MRPRLGAAALALLLLAVPVPAHAASTGGPQWFGPTDVDAGWHLRIGLTVHNPYSGPMVNAPVAAELDLARALLDAGWTGFDAGGGPTLTGFELDPGSVRVVQVSNLDTYGGTGSPDGRNFGEVPSLAIPGLLGRASPAADVARAFDARSNPALTVFFRVPGTLAADGSASFEVYFDTVANGPKLPSTATGTGPASLDALHWHTAGTVLYGQQASRSGQPNTVTVVAALPGTHVRVERLQAGRFATTGVDLDGGNPATLGAGQSAVARLGPAADPVFRVVADGPVVAAADPSGFVPALDGGLVGKSFVLRTPPASADGGAGVYLINPGSSEATVRVARDGGGSTSYTLPAGFYGGSNLECDPGGTWTPLQEDHAYTVTVTSGGPILVQLQPRLPQQIPSSDGAPTGTGFRATMEWSSESNCGLARSQPFRAAALAPGGTLSAASLETPVQAFPPGTGANQAPPPAALPSPPAASDPLTASTDGPMRDRPLTFTASVPTRLYAGGALSSGQPTPMAGPLGGSGAGRSFLALTGVLVIAPYPETHVSAQVQYTGGSATLSQALGRDGVWPVDRDAAMGSVQSARITSDRPVLVYPLGGSAGFLAGIPAFLDSTPDKVQYRGRLLDIRSESGDDPLTGSVRSGETASFALVVTNLGKGVDGSPGPTESVGLSVTGVPSGWTVSLDRPDGVTLAPDQSETVHLLVRAPDGALANEPPASLTVSATSHDKPSVRDDLNVVVFVKTSFGVGLWFLAPEVGPKTLTTTLAPGTTGHYKVFLQNLGSQRDTILLSAGAADAPGSAHLLDLAGDEVHEATLDPGEARELNLTIDAGTRPDALLFTTVTAQSETAASALARITALVRVRLGTDIALTVADDLVLAPDGEETLVHATLANLGGSATTVQLEALSDAPAPWLPAGLFVVDPATHERLPVSRLTLDPSSAQDLVLNLTVPEGWPAGAVVSLRVLASAEGGSTADAPVTAVVAARHRLDVRPEADPLPVRTGNTTTTLALANRGNLNETLTLLPADLPPGWSLGLPPSVFVERNGTALASVVLSVPAAAPPAAYGLALRFLALDGHAIEAPLNVTLAPSLAGQAGAGGVIAAQPGQELPVSWPFHNSGNRPVTATLRARTGEAWALQPGLAVPVAAGANATLSAVLSVPRDAPDGRGTHQALVHAVAGDAQGGATDVPVSFTVDVGRPNLRAEAGTVAAGPAGRVVSATVANDGSRPAYGVTVTVVGAGGQPESQQVLPVLEAGHEAQVLLAVPGTAAEKLVLKVDPQDQVVEANEQDNQADVGAATHGAPGLPFVLLGVAVFVVAAGRRRKGR